MNRETFLEYIKNKLELGGFNLINDEYKRIVQVRQQGPTMIINGQRIEQQDELITLEFTIKLMGEGSIDDDKFEMIGFNVCRENETIFELNQSFYYDEIYLFNDLYDKFFNV